MNYTHRMINVRDLVLDVRNPRIDDRAVDEESAARELLTEERGRLVRLAKHIAKYGLDPTRTLLVIPQQNTSKYVVMDGNRRILALRLLGKPESARGILSVSDQQVLAALSDRYCRSPITVASCCIFPDRQAADTWILLQHLGVNQGAGTVGRNSMAKRRYLERLAEQPGTAVSAGTRPSTPAAGKASAAIFVAIRDHNHPVGSQLAGLVSAATREAIRSGQYPITNLDRMLASPDVRTLLHLQSLEKVKSLEIDNAAICHLAALLESLGPTGGVTVSALTTVDKRLKHAQTVASRVEAGITTGGVSRDPEHQAVQGPLVRATIPSLPTPRARSAKLRKYVVPGSFAVVTDNRIGQIVTELKSLVVQEFPNCSAVMLRVVIETACKHYRRALLSDERDISLKDSVTVVRNDLRQRHELSDSDKDAITVAVDSHLLDSTRALHAYVHNCQYRPLALDVVSTWDNIGVFLEAMWRVEMAHAGRSE